MNKRFFIFIAIILLLSACVQYKLVETGKPQLLAQAFEVEPQINWSKTAYKKIEKWTVDGPALEAITFYKGYVDGESLYTIHNAQKNLPVYRNSMTPNEIMEFFVDSLIAVDRAGYEWANFSASKATTSGLRPFKFAEQRGFRFDLEFSSANGLKYKGFVIGSVIEEKLYLICYSGEKQHYYPKYKAAAEKVVASLNLVEHNQ